MPPITLEQALQLALQCHQTGKLPEAEHLYGQILMHHPMHADALHYLGVLSHQKGENDKAIDLIHRAVQARPIFPEAYNHLSVVLCAMGRSTEAAAACRVSIEQNPDNPDATYNLGNSLKDAGQLDEAIAAFRKTIALRPDWPMVHNNLITALMDHGQYDLALVAANEAVALLPESADVLCSLGNAIRINGRWDEAIAIYRRVLEIDPNHASACSELGFALQLKGEWNDATAFYRRALALEPNLPDAHFNLSTQLLLRGDFDQGWKEYEWRWRLTGPAAGWQPPHRRWDGSDLNGKTILLHPEQGYGDLLQFIRYAPQVAERGGKVVLVCLPEMHRLLRTLPGIDQCIMHGQPLPKIDVQCPLMSLPLVFQTSLNDIPATVPYLQPDAADTEKWRSRLAENTSKLKVGLVWAGRPAHVNDARRSISLSTLQPLAQLPDITFFSLQKGEKAVQAKNPPAGMHMIDYTDELTDFADTAAFISNLDLVISVDTAVVHLTGAIGKPVWVLLPKVPDWRWLLDREDSPWYPTMRLFRQPVAGDWQTVITAVTQQLSAFLKTRADSPPV